MYRISVDVGGTFTDVVVADDAGTLTLGKALTTPQRSYLGLRGGLENAAEQLGVDADHLLHNASLLTYGTTRSTNAVVQGLTAKTAFLTTEGFPNILHYRQGGKERPFDLSRGDLPPYVPGKFTYQVPERINAEGGIERPLDEAALGVIIDRLRRQSIESVAVCLLWSTVNDAHERRVGELLDRELPDVPHTLSSALNPVIREYPRASATCIDASLKPLMQEHFRRLSDDLSGSGFRGELMVSASSGGLMKLADTVDKPVYTVKSGPAMAPLAGLHYAQVEQLGNDVIICDTGGTTFDVSVVRTGNVRYSRETWLLGRWVGHNLGMSTVDVRSIGAGGGSIAWVDPGGLLHVGPESAGSEPGPACYGRGGTRPTVTDAAVVLGYIDPDFFLGGRMKLDVDAARRAVGELADQLSMSPDRTAFGILSIANEEMIKAIREVTINDGINPRESVVVAGGGAAGLNIGPIAAALGCKQVLIPRMAGGLSACGAQYSDIVLEVTASHYARTSDFDAEAVERTLQDLHARLASYLRDLAAQGLTRHRLDLSVEARYVGQQWELSVDLPFTHLSGDDAEVSALLDAFHVTHERQYAVRDESSIVECINWKLRLTVELDRPVGSTPQELSDAPPEAARTVDTYFGGDDRMLTPVYDGTTLYPGHRVLGPAVIEEPTTTIVVYPGMTAELSRDLNYLLTTV